MRIKFQDWCNTMANFDCLFLSFVQVTENVHENTNGDREL